MLYSTVVQRDESGFNQIYEAALQFEELNVMQAIIDCKFDQRKTEQTLNLVRMYQVRLNIESMDLVAFSENFIESYATDHNECFRLAEKLIRRIGTTITGSMKIFRKFCPVVHRKLKGSNIVPTLDYSRLTFRPFHGQFFGVEVYTDLVKTLLHEIATFFYHLVITLKVCKDMIQKEEEVRGDYERLKVIFENSCDEVLHGVRDVFDTFGQIKLVSDEELEEHRKNARPMKEWLAPEYHAHDTLWLKRKAYRYRVASGRQYGLDEKASILWSRNPDWGRMVCDIIPKLDTLKIPYKNSKKATKQGKKGSFDVRYMVYLIKWSGVSWISDDGTLQNEPKEKQFYIYLQEKYNGDFLFPTWQAVCRERRYLYEIHITMQEMAEEIASLLTEAEAA